MRGAVLAGGLGALPGVRAAAGHRAGLSVALAAAGPARLLASVRAVPGRHQGLSGPAPGRRAGDQGANVKDNWPSDRPEPEQERLLACLLACTSTADMRAVISTFRANAEVDDMIRRRDSRTILLIRRRRPWWERLLP